MRNVVPRMARIPDVEALLCAAPQSVDMNGWIENHPKIEFVNCRPFRPFRYSAGPELYEQLRRFSPDVILVPVERHLKVKGVPVVNMVQNMGPLVSSVIDNPVREKIRHFFQAIETKISVRKAERIIAVSDFVRDFLVNNWAVSKDRINVIYYGCDLPEDNSNSDRPDAVPEDWKGNFLFTAGSILPLRGLEDLLEAVECLFSQDSKISGLVIAGRATHNMGAYEKKLKEWVRTRGLSSRVIWTGRISDEEMSWCYDHCRAFVMTSRVESFGNIAIESMAHGCINIAADNPCLPEIFGDTAVYYSPKDWNALAETIASVAAWDSDRRRKESVRAKKRAAEFSWDIGVEKTVAALKKAIATY